MKFPLDSFWRFCSQLRVDTKERGQTTLSKEILLGTQTHFIEEIVKGLENDVHFFVDLKGRQLGITTICLALDLFWHFRHSGMQGTLIADGERNREQNRATLRMYLEGLPNAFKIPAVTHNRNQLVLRNRSRILYQVAGAREQSKAAGALGRGSAIAYLHGTETSSWGNEEGFASLLASLAEHNPRRLFVFESTARGFNLFNDLWEGATRASTQCAIFSGWWRNQFYSIPQSSNIFKVYWDGKFTSEERIWVREIKNRYGFDITPEQIAWWRWKTYEVIKDADLMLQEYPPTEDYAFIMTGSQFFSSGSITDAMKLARKKDYQSYRFYLGDNFQDTSIHPSKPGLATLKVWELPDPNGVYVVGADPAYGASDWADRFCAQVYRCYSDCMEQVAEFCTEDCTTYQFAWVLCYLCGAYGNTILNLEITGPGQAVLNEIQNLKRMAISAPTEENVGIFNVVSNIRQFLYRRIDTFAGSYALHWKTNRDSKSRMMNCLRDNFERKLLIINSVECLNEMKCIRQDEGIIEAPGRKKDDRAIATALAAVCWNGSELGNRSRLVALGRSYAEAQARKNEATPMNTASAILSRHLKSTTGG
jgi:hypothetical protein